MAQSTITVQHDMEFGVHDGDSLTGDLYSPAEAPVQGEDGSGPFPALVALHGGGWKLGSSQSYQYWGPWLAQHGYAVFSVNYRLLQGDKNRYPASVHDSRAAVQFLKTKSEELRIDPDRIGMIGDSAGAHLSALTALAGDTPLFANNAYPGDAYAGVSTSVKAVIGIYGVYDMLAQWEHDQTSRPLDQITQNLLGKSPMESKWLFYEASPMSYTTVDNNQTAFLIVWGDEDDIVDRHSQSEAFVNSLKQAGFFTRTVIVPGAPHFWMSDPLDEPRSHPAFLAPRLLRFLQDRL